MKTKFEKLLCEESVCLISVCRLGMAESLSMMRRGEDRQKTGQGLGNICFINDDMFSVLISF